MSSTSVDIFFIVISLLLVGFFSGLELAFLTANKLSIELKKKQGKNSGIIMAKFMEEPSRFIGTTLIGSNLFLVIYVLLFAKVLQPVMG